MFFCVKFFYSFVLCEILRLYSHKGHEEARREESYFLLVQERRNKRKTDIVGVDFQNEKPLHKLSF